MISTSSPLFVEVLLDTIYVLLASGTGLVVWSLWRGARTAGSARRGADGRADGAEGRGLTARRIAWGTALLTAGLLATTWALGSTAPIAIGGGRVYDDTFWLRISDMLINTSLALIAVAAVCTVLSVKRFKTKG